MRLHEFVNLQEDGGASAGGTCSGSIATVAQPLGGMISRSGGSFFTGAKYSNSADPYPNTPAYMKKGKKSRAK
jgi:hypothetical protein